MSKFYHIGCFNHPKAIPVLEQRKRELEINEVSPAVTNCAELAQGKDYKFFSVGYKGICYSGPQANETYFSKGTATAKKKCAVNGVGKKGASVVYTFGKSVNFRGKKFIACSLLNSFFLNLFLIHI